MYNAIKFGQKIKILRKAKQLTTYQLATRLHISPNYLNEIENGRSIPSVELFISIINYFKITYENYDYSKIFLEANQTQFYMTKLKDIEYKFLYETLLGYITCINTSKE